LSKRRDSRKGQPQNPFLNKYFCFDVRTKYVRLPNTWGWLVLAHLLVAPLAGNIDTDKVFVGSRAYIKNLAGIWFSDSIV
jgi:hypothetical protein